MLFQNFLNTWWDHEIADSAQPRYRSIVTRPFFLLVRAGSGHETRLPLGGSIKVLGVAAKSVGQKFGRMDRQPLDPEVSKFFFCINAAAI